LWLEDALVHLDDLVLHDACRARAQTRQQTFGGDVTSETP